MEIYVKGNKITLNPKSIIGEGGEAKIYLYRNSAVKIYHPNMLSKRREEKLKAFPRNLPANVMAPKDLVLDQNGKVIGFSMELVEDAEALIALSNKMFRENFSGEKVSKLFLDKLETLEKIHSAQAVVGDLNDLNVLFKGEKSIFIDADSMQFGKFPCEVATEQFLDPRLYGIDFSKRPVFTPESDFYSFSVLLFRSLLLVNPFGGVHPKLPTLIRRAEKRLTVFNSEVRYPKAAIPFRVLPDDMLDYFQKVFEKDRRGKFPRNLLENLRWTKCSICGELHARAVCPYCAHQAPAAVKEVIAINRKCSSTRVFATKGRIIFAKMESGKIKFVWEENGTVRRENGEKVMADNPDNFTHFSIMGSKTIVGRKNRFVIIEREKVLGQWETGMLGNWPVIESAEADYFHIKGEYLFRNGNKIVGNVLENQTWIKVGTKFGFGFYRIGLKTVYFVFNPERTGINDSVTLPKIEGQLIDAECVFSDRYALFLVSTKENGKIWNAMHLIDENGKIKGSAKEEAENSRMLSRIRNKTLGGDKVLTASDEGLILVAAENGKLEQERIFSDTEPFVDEESRIFAAAEGIYVVSEKEVKLLKLI